MPSSFCTISGPTNQLSIGCATVRVRGQTGFCTNQGQAITPFMFNEEEYRVNSCLRLSTCSDVLQYACDDNGVEYPSAHEFYCHSNIHNPDQDGFKDLYCQDFIYAISWVVQCKLSSHRLDPYQCAAFRCGIIRHNTGKEEADPVLELSMEYVGALGTIIFDELCCLHNLTEAQVGRNQFAVNVAVDWLDESINEVDG